MSGPELALVFFTACNSVRVLAYLPQITAVARDRNGASAISYTTWGMFAVSHLSTVLYAHLVLHDPRMAAIFAANTLCCALIVGLTAYKRGLFGLRPRLAHRGRSGIVAASAVVLLGAAIAAVAWLSAPNVSSVEAKAQGADVPQPQASPPVAQPQASPANPPPPASALEHQARLLAESHALFETRGQCPPAIMSLTGVGEADPDVWRSFDLGTPAVLTDWHWSPAPAAEPRPRATRPRTGRAPSTRALKRPAPKSTASARLTQTTAKPARRSPLPKSSAPLGQLTDRND